MAERPMSLSKALALVDSWGDSEAVNTGLHRIARNLRKRVATQDAEVGKARRRALEEAALIADEYASVNIEAAGDSILLDPVLSGHDHSAEAFELSEKLTIDGCIHSSMFHAARNIAAAIRDLKRAQAQPRGQQ